MRGMASMLEPKTRDHCCAVMFTVASSRWLGGFSYPVREQ